MLSLNISYWRGGWITMCKWKIKSAKILEWVGGDKEIRFDVNDSYASGKKICLFYKYFHIFKMMTLSFWIGWSLMWKSATELQKVSKCIEGLQEDHLLGEQERQQLSVFSDPVELVLPARGKLLTIRQQSKLQWELRFFTLLSIHALCHVISGFPPNVGRMISPASW